MADIYYDMDANPVVPMVRFGSKEHQEIRLDRAEVLLTWLFTDRPQAFRDGMCVAYDMEIPAASRKPRTPKAGQ